MQSHPQIAPPIPGNQPPKSFADWAVRNAHWQELPKRRAYRAKGQRPTEPLILCGHDVSLNVDRGTLAIRNGLTHYPQERETHRYFKGAANLPPRIIMLDGSGSLSFDVLAWLSEQRVPLFKVDYRGELISVVAGSAYGYDPERVAWQVQTRADPERRLAFCCDLIGAKLKASVRTMAEVLPDSRAGQVALATAEASIHQLAQGSVRDVDEVRLIEARAASAYFTAWRPVSIPWRSQWKQPIPDEWLTIGFRRSNRRPFANNRYATHPVNAMLNYVYAVLHSAVQTEAVADGYDPTKGIMHESRTDAAALVLDFIEPRRPVADAALLRFIAANEFCGADFVNTAKGVCRVAPQLARLIAGLHT